jgi:tRNA(Ile)-lysidine synthase
MAASRNSPSTEPVEAAVAACLARHAVPAGAILLVGLSGGVDSVVLLRSLVALGRQPRAIHVNHGLSSHAADWVRHCRSLCAELDVRLQVVEVTVERGSADGLEAAARRARHDVYGRTDGDWLLLGHHVQDRAETMLFNLLRGAGVRGAGAMPERNGRILRPLLKLTRQQIVDYALACGLAWVDDDSNEDIRHSRNYLRHRILAPLEERFPAAANRLAAAAERFAEAADLLDQLAEADLGDAPAAFPIELAVLVRLSEPRARNVLRLLLARAGIGIPGEARLTEALDQFLHAAPDRHPSVAFGPARLVRRRGRIEIAE